MFVRGAYKPNPEPEIITLEKMLAAGIGWREPCERRNTNDRLV